ncbi:MAG TPA: type II toxin-antitoxin system VapC family toxin [Chloroflexota bacterium]|nr:type II toxin-antitoxin system VapC family toxin [Chloroflexota bacterium]
MHDVSPYVLDASVAVKWHLHDEGFVAEARRLLVDLREGRIQIIAPDHVRYEVSSAIRNAVRMGRILPEAGATAIDQFLSWNVPTVAASDLIRAGYGLALRFGCSLYDGLYLALAEATGFPLVYADHRLRNALGSRFPLALWIEDYPGQA